MLTVVKNSEDSNTISIPAEEMEKLGIKDGDEVEVSKNENDEIVLRSISEAERKRKFEKAKNEIFEEWHDVFVELAKGAGDESITNKSDGKLVLSKTENGYYTFVLQEVDGTVVFESPHYASKQEAQKAIDSLKKLPVEVELETV